MRELLDLAIDKGVARFVDRARRSGLLAPAAAPPPRVDDDERFEEQIEDMG